MNHIKSKQILIIVGLIIIVLISILLGSSYRNNAEIIEKSETATSTPLNTELSGDELKQAIDLTLTSLMKVHYVSKKDIETTDPETVVLDMLQESMNDVNKLKNISYDVENLVKSKNKIISTTGMSLSILTNSLTHSYTTLIQYLRTVDINNLDIPEFQYQLSLFQTSTHDAYLKLIEGTSLFPMIIVNFSETDKSNNINREVQTYLSTRINDLFTDILIDDDKYHAETNNRYTVPVIIRQYKEFLK